MPLSVVTLNIWNDDGPWPERAKRIRSWIERLDPDVIGLQEVLKGESIDQLGTLLQGLGYHTIYARAQDFWKHPGTGFGNAIASRFPILDSEELRLPLGGLCEEDRAFIDALLARTLSRPEVMDEIRRRFPPGHRRSG